MVKLWFLIIVLLRASSSAAYDAGDLVIVVISQPNKYHLELGEKLRNNIRAQAETLNKGLPVVHLSHIEFPHIGGWTIVPLIPSLAILHGNNSSWIVFTEDRTQVKLNKLLEALNKYDSEEETWLGYALQDNEPTIIHHFAFSDNPKRFRYPNLASGFTISKALLQALSVRLKKPDVLKSDFNIDSAYELALFIWDKERGHALNHEPAFCISEETHCGTFPKYFQPCEEPVPKESIYFAVKTCEMYHTDRVPVVKNTWGQHALHINFFSDVEDRSVPSVSLGIPNTANGHCGKTMAIIKHVAKEIVKLPEVKWVIISDDDTILSCYDPSSAVALGERYGYNVHNPEGYNYITGGGGIVLSRILLLQLSLPGNCDCPSISSPDDMFLGICVARLGITITHSPLFHQARPVDYAPEYLTTQSAVSFHKHWMIDPLDVYKKWFLESDLQKAPDFPHVEL